MILNKYVQSSTIKLTLIELLVNFVYIYNAILTGNKEDGLSFISEKAQTLLPTENQEKIKIKIETISNI